MLAGWMLPVALLIFEGSNPVKISAPQPFPSETLVARFWQEQPAYDGQAESDLLDLANRARRRSDAPPLEMQDCLTLAAQKHAAAMAAHREISHQFPGEAGLAQRLAATCSFPVDEAAENVGLSDSSDRMHDQFMHSRPHRANLLYPSYNMVGIGVARSGAQLYVVEDFVHGLPQRSAQNAGSLVAASVAKTREQAGQPRLEIRDGHVLEAEACALARADSLRPAATESSGARYILRFTSMDPQNLPAAAAKAIDDPATRAFAAGACFGRTPTYPNGAYWIVLALY